MPSDSGHAQGGQVRERVEELFRAVYAEKLGARLVEFEREVADLRPWNEAKRQRLREEQRELEELVRKIHRRFKIEALLQPDPVAVADAVRSWDPEEGDDG